jgi:hypothetical protein
MRAVWWGIVMDGWKMVTEELGIGEVVWMGEDWVVRRLGAVGLRDREGVESGRWQRCCGSL